VDSHGSTAEVQEAMREGGAYLDAGELMAMVVAARNNYNSYMSVVLTSRCHTW
jgi:hypothetical protein